MTGGQIPYAVTAIVGIVSNVVAWHSFGPTRTLPSAIDFLYGWWPSELPLVSLAIQAGIVAAAAGCALHGIPVLVLLTLQVLSWAGLIGQWRLARAARTQVAAVVAETIAGFGLVAHPRATTRPAPGVIGIGRARGRYALDQGIAYGPDRANLLDLWRLPDTGADAPAPVVVHVPGGGWIYGDRRHQGYALLSHLVERGWLGVSIQYRLSPQHRWPSHVEDVAAALAWVREHVAEHGGDPAHVVLTGGSAGGHLVSLTGLLGGRPTPGGAEPVPTVQAVVAMYPMTDWTGGSPSHLGARSLLEKAVIGLPYAGHEATYEAASPIRQVRPDAPLFVVAHGTNDEMIPVGQSDAFVAALRATSTAPVSYLRLPRAHHGFDVFGSVRTRAVVAGVGDILGAHWASRR